jgi:hypothetical protein
VAMTLWGNPRACFTKGGEGGGADGCLMGVTFVVTPEGMIYYRGEEGGREMDAFGG